MLIRGFSTAGALRLMALAGCLCLMTDSAAQGPANRFTLDTRLAIAPDGQAPGTPRGLGPDELLQYAWEFDPRIQAATMQAKGAGLDVEAAKAGWFPFASVAATRRENGGGTSVRLVQPLWDGGLTRAQVDGANAQREVALAELRKTQMMVANEVFAAYVDVVGASRQARQWQGYRAELDSLLSIARRRVAEGVSAETEVQTALSRLHQAETGYEMARLSMENGLIRLARLVGRNPGELRLQPFPKPHLPREAEAEADWLEAHPEVVVASWGALRQEAEARRVAAQAMPQLQLQYRFDVEGVRASETDGAVLVMQYQTSGTLQGLRSARAERERAKAAQEQVRLAREDVRLRVRALDLEVRAISRQVEAARMSVEATDRLVDSFFRQFEAGRRSWIEVLNIAREANELKLQVIAAEKAGELAKARLLVETLNTRRGSISGAGGRYEPEDGARAETQAP